uniref:Uncharacterized protein n=1 Tax=Zea mays TaxID=4577 RepID=A0A804QRK0_MAIZE
MEERDVTELFRVVSVTTIAVPVDDHLDICRTMNRTSPRLTYMWESRIGALESMVTDSVRHLDALSADVRADLVAHQATVDEVVDD